MQELKMKHSEAPKTAFIMEVAPGRHLAEFSVNLPNAPGTLAAASEILAKHHVNILSGCHDTARWAFFADLTESEASIEQLEHELGSVKGVTEVFKVDSPNGVMVDSLLFPILWGENRAILLRAATLSSILERIKKMFGEDGPVAKVLIFAMGAAAGQATIKATTAQIGPNVREVSLASVLKVYSATGWGIFRLSQIDFDLCMATVVALDNFECAPHQGSGSKPVSQFIRGHLSGMFSELFGRRVNVVETACLAHGESFCEFSIMPPEDAT